jgi:hypothetical protein
VIRAVAETLDVICSVRGIEVRDLDDAVIDNLLLSSFGEFLGNDTVIAGTLRTKRS